MSLPLPDPGFLVALSLVLLLGVLGLAADRYGCDSRPIEMTTHRS